jgi:hypothetical protein
MPPAAPAAAAAFWTAIAAGTTAGGMALSARSQSRASGRATAAQTSANDAALAYQKEKDARDEARQAEDRRLAKEAWDAEQQRQLPRRAALASLLRARGINVPDPGARPYNPDASAADTRRPADTSMASSSLAALYGAPYADMSPGVQAPDVGMTIADFFRRRNDNLNA